MDWKGSYPGEKRSAPEIRAHRVGGEINTRIMCRAKSVLKPSSVKNGNIYNGGFYHRNLYLITGNQLNCFILVDVENLFSV